MASTNLPDVFYSKLQFRAVHHGCGTAAISTCS